MILINLLLHFLNACAESLACMQAVKFKRDNQTEKAFGWVQVNLIVTGTNKHITCAATCFDFRSSFLHPLLPLLRA
jgi:hypothetical protein